ncbi:hypothetical protein ACFP1I_23845 [Dyadobacter subterraneus]|uniref:Outer membrane protein beta-barrel domain-containing protein n=1 Tax=Dyadobacter subterraneus TaxID=2773304 RepID=A0ABR9WR05_9BACT|nr:hypothetical protein [Dyadobacter subterraneus]MBE9466519.1 hypothetical protein [Dyadobacter subterraneus]
MNRQIFTTSLLLLIAFCKTVSAQKNYEPGFVIVNQKDTLRGFINYKNWSKNPETISFKTVLEADETTYGTADISGFQVHGENYLKATVDKDISPSNDEDLSYSSKAIITKVTVFLLVEYLGLKRFYYLKDADNKVQMYIGNGPDEFELLDNYRYRVENGIKSGVISSARYKNQLKVFFQDCPSLDKSFTNLRYSPSDIESLFKTYYSKCSLEKSEIAFVQEKIITEAGVLVGLTRTKTAFKGNIQGLTDLDYSASNNLTVGGFLNFVIPRTRKRFSINNELTYNSYKTTAPGMKYYIPKDLVLDYSYINLKNMFRYKIPVGTVSLFINLGVSNGMAIKSKNFIGDSRKYEQGLLAGIGGYYNKFSFELRHENSNGMSVYKYFQSTIKRNYLILAYRLK